VNRRIATLMVHTSPLDQAGTGDAGGMNIYVCEAAQQMAALGISVDIFTRRANNDHPDIVDQGNGVRIIHLNVGPVDGVKKEDLPALIPDLSAAFKEALTSGPTYDVIHSHYWISGKVAMPVAAELNIPLVHTMHTMARVKNLNLAEGESPEPMIRVQGESQVVAAADALIANTDAEAASLVSLYEACPDNVSVVSPGVNLQMFTAGKGKLAARKELGISQSGNIISFVGRIQPHKGPEILIRSIAEMVSHSPALRGELTVMIIGGASGSSTAEVSRMRELAQWLGIDDIVKFEPPVERAALANYYRAADLVCVPSYSESFGLVALEAQACGTPVVASAVGGLRTAVADGISGVLVDGHDPRAWSSVLARLLQEPQRRILLSMGALEHASHFGWSATARGTLDIYDRVMDAKNAAKKSVG
jgi:D-inositol-3-phosphate glycosyltransferase